MTATRIFSLGTSGTVNGVETFPGWGAHRILLGKFVFTAGTVPGVATHIRATDFSELDDTTYRNTGSVPWTP